MCRHLFLNKAHSEKYLKEIIEKMIKSQGGAGNGVGWWENGKKVIHKGVELSADACVALILSNDIYPKVFHTRLVSAGSKCDDQCHPFDAGHYILTHNGSWGTYKEARWGLLGYGIPNHVIYGSDTQVAAEIIKLQGIDFLWYINSGTWIAVSEKTLYVYYLGGSFFVWRNKEGLWEGGSEVVCAPKCDIFDLKMNTCLAIRGDKLKVLAGNLIETSYEKETSRKIHRWSGDGDYHYPSAMFEKIVGGVSPQTSRQPILSEHDKKVMKELGMDKDDAQIFLDDIKPILEAQGEYAAGVI